MTAGADVGEAISGKGKRRGKERARMEEEFCSLLIFSVYDLRPVLLAQRRLTWELVVKMRKGLRNEVHFQL